MLSWCLSTLLVRILLRCGKSGAYQFLAPIPPRRLHRSAVCVIYTCTLPTIQIYRKYTSWRFRIRFLHFSFDVLWMYTVLSGTSEMYLLLPNPLFRHFHTSICSWKQAQNSHIQFFSKYLCVCLYRINSGFLYFIHAKMNAWICGLYFYDLWSLHARMCQEVCTCEYGCAYKLK